jgi:hypothetical protein
MWGGKKKMKRFFLWPLVLALGLAACKSDHGPVRVSSLRPKYPDRKIELTKLYVIDVTQINMFSKDASRGFDNAIDFDGNNNMYVLDTYESTIAVFDNHGRFVRSFGGPGQGPGEFSRPSMMFIKGDEIYVLQGWGLDFKVVNLDGEFISTQQVHFENPFRYLASGNDIYLFSCKTDPTFSRLEFILRRFATGRFEQAEVLWTLNYPPGLNGPNYDFIWPNWLAISDSGEFYFPEDNLNKYSITKYTKEGKPALVFGRKYEIREYSQQARDRFNSLFSRQIKTGEMKFPSSPPVLRKMFQDQRKNIWVISGETYEDNEDPEFENAVDVFGEKGEWLYSFRTKSISRNCLYNDGVLYAIPPMDPDTFEQRIEAFRIKY